MNWFCKVVRTLRLLRGLFLGHFCNPHQITPFYSSRLPYGSEGHELTQKGRQNTLFLVGLVSWSLLWSTADAILVSDVPVFFTGQQVVVLRAGGATGRILPSAQPVLSGSCHAHKPFTSAAEKCLSVNFNPSSCPACRIQLHSDECQKLRLDTIEIPNNCGFPCKSPEDTRTHFCL